MRTWTQSLIFCLVALAIALPAETMASMEGVLLNNSNMRSSPMVQQGNIVEVLPLGTQVQVLVQGNGWNLVSKDYTQVGWVADWLIDMQQEAAEIVPIALEPLSVGSVAPLEDSPAISDVQVEKIYGIVQLNSNMRTAPMQTVLQVIPKGIQIEILSLENKWYKVRTQEGSVGWIAEWLIEPVKNNAQVQTASVQQKVGIVPFAIDTQELNNYWVLRVNELRKAVGLRMLQSSEILTDTAAMWANYIGGIKQLTHVRIDGNSMHDWAAAHGIPFADRYSTGGWNINYFTENIGRNPAQATMESAKHALDVMLANFVAENNGPHYRTVYHVDWNSVGSGFYFDPVGDGMYQMYAVFHYASLKESIDK